MVKRHIFVCSFLFLCLFLMKNHLKEMVFEGGGGGEREDDYDDDDDDNVNDTNSLELAKNLITE